MADSVSELIELLRVERLEDNLFRGTSTDVGNIHVFGGQVLGQAVMAAAGTVQGRVLHSLHAYFLRPGDKSARIVYEVDPIRDGGTFTTRRVVAIQHGQPIFNFAASFQTPEPGHDHEASMPVVVPPDQLPDENELRARYAAGIPEKWRAKLLRQRPIEMRALRPIDPIHPDVREPQMSSWMRAREALPDEPVLHQAMLAYASDFSLLRTALLPHGLSFFQRGMQSASLDHAMWFHRSFRMDQWLLYCTDSPSASGARGFCRGSIHSQDGHLVASVAQEGLVRIRRETKADAA